MIMSYLPKIMAHVRAGVLSYCVGDKLLSAKNNVNNEATICGALYSNDCKLFLISQSQTNHW